MIKENQLKTMLDLQEAMNNKVNPNWRDANYEWRDAVFTEACEAFNHTGWEWWKNQGKEPDYNQIKLEIVDIWHFIVSELLSYEETEECNYYILVNSLFTKLLESVPENYNPGKEDLQYTLKMLIKIALVDKNEEGSLIGLISAFVPCMVTARMTFDELYKLYIGKNMLNMFRQNNGYKTSSATYKGIWASESGWEDNQYLTQMLNQELDVESPTFKDDITNALTLKFKELKGLDIVLY